MRTDRRATPRYPQPVKLAAGEVRHWCACGHSDTAPFCSDDRCGAGERLSYTARKEEIVLFCGCGATRTPPHCDGAHIGLRDREPWWQRFKSWFGRTRPRDHL